MRTISVAVLATLLAIPSGMANPQTVQTEEWYGWGFGSYVSTDAFGCDADLNVASVCMRAPVGTGHISAYVNGTLEGAVTPSMCFTLELLASGTAIVEYVAFCGPAENISTPPGFDEVRISPFVGNGLNPSPSGTATVVFN